MTEITHERRAYNLRTAFKLLHISESYGYQLIRDGKIKTVRLGPASPRITAEEIDRILRDGISAEEVNRGETVGRKVRKLKKTKTYGSLKLIC